MFKIALMEITASSTTTS